MRLYRLIISLLLSIAIPVYSATLGYAGGQPIENSRVERKLDSMPISHGSRVLVSIPLSLIFASTNTRIVKITVTIDGATTNEISLTELIYFQASGDSSEIKSDDTSLWFNIPLSEEESLLVPGEYDCQIKMILENGKENELYRARAWFGDDGWYQFSQRAKLADYILYAQLQACDEAIGEYSGANKSLFEPISGSVGLLLISYKGYLEKDLSRYNGLVTQLSIAVDSKLHPSKSPVIDKEQALNAVESLEELAYNSSGDSPAYKIIRLQLLAYVGGVLDSVNTRLTSEEAEIPGSTTKDRPSARIFELKSEQQELLDLYLKIQRILALTPGFSLEPGAAAMVSQP